MSETEVSKGKAAKESSRRFLAVHESHSTRPRGKIHVVGFPRGLS